MSYPQIASIEIRPEPLSLEVKWSTGETDVVDMTGVIVRSDVLQPLGNQVGFASARVINGGDGLGWDVKTPDGEYLDYGADALWVLAQEQRPMTGANLRETREKLGLSQFELATILDIDERTIRNQEQSREVSRILRIALRSLTRNRTVVGAHLTMPPRRPGRPRGATTKRT